MLSDLGSGLVLSLANTELALQTSDAEIMYTMRALEGAGIGWLGTHAKKSHILAMKKERVGVLAFCGVHKECGSGNSLSPFSPVKYSAKAAKSAVKELKEVQWRLPLTLGDFLNTYSSVLDTEVSLLWRSRLQRFHSIVKLQVGSPMDGSLFAFRTCGTKLLETKVIQWNLQ